MKKVLAVMIALMLTLCTVPALAEIVDLGVLTMDIPAEMNPTLNDNDGNMVMVNFTADQLVCSVGVINGLPVSEDEVAPYYGIFADSVFSSMGRKYLIRKTYTVTLGQKEGYLAQADVEIIEGMTSDVIFFCAPVGGALVVMSAAQLFGDTPISDFESILPMITSPAFFAEPLVLTEN